MSSSSVRLSGATAVAVAALLLAAPVASGEEAGAAVAPEAFVAAPEPAASVARPAGEGRPRPGRPTGGQVVRPEEAGPAVGPGRGRDTAPGSDHENDPGGGTGSDRDSGGDGDTGRDPQTGTTDTTDTSGTAGKQTGSGTGKETGTGAAAGRRPGGPSPAASAASAASVAPSGDATHPARSTPPSATPSATPAAPSRARPDRHGKDAGTDRNDGTDETDENGTAGEYEVLPEGVAPIPEASSAAHPPDADAPRERDSAFVTNASRRPVSVLTLGTGITLIGLGLGFLGVRLRQR
ncbi:hypothetical protein ACFXKG_06140 [Streptomyces sp. NPDC059255]|uniref:hypothetical protein n=1 Tax=Streptomyces sp. NPDC059255 TaxID=3346793 RepID=UPI00368112AC